MFHNPNADSLNAQMAAQRPLIDHWQRVLAIPDDRVVHALLLPKRLADRNREGIFEQRVITWEAIHEAYQTVAHPYWVSVLGEALRRHAELESRFTDSFAPNSDGFMTGQAIVNAWQNDALTVGYVGRRNGRHGPKFQADVSNGTWRSQRYQTRSEPIAAKNWFPVTEFLAAIADQL